VEASKKGVIPQIGTPTHKMTALLNLQKQQLSNVWNVYQYYCYAIMVSVYCYTIWQFKMK